MPSLWNLAAFHVSRYVLLNTGQIKADPGDRGDSAIYSEAAYADVLVTEDKIMRRVIANIRGPKVRVQTIQEFTAEWTPRVRSTQ